MNRINRILLILFVLVACVGCDQSTKTYAESNLPKARALSFLADTIRLQVAHNEGAFLSFGESAPKSWRLAALRLGVSVLLLVLLGYMLRTRIARPLFIFALSLILAGGVSNLICQTASNTFHQSASNTFHQSASNSFHFSSILRVIFTLLEAVGIVNLIDRFTHGGYVVDFINLGIGALRTGIFNVADIAITSGVLLLLVQSWRTNKSGEDSCAKTRRPAPR